MKVSKRAFFRDYSLTILVALGIAFLLRTYVIEAYQISNDWMKPTLLKGDTIFAGKWPAWLKQKGFPKRGDILIYKETTDKVGPEHLKRLIGLPGDVIQIRNGILSVNQERLNEADKGGCYPETLDQVTYEICREAIPMDDFGPAIIPPGSYFLIDDLRIQNFKHKRHKTWAIIPENAIKGQALWIWLSIDPRDKTSTQSTWLPTFRFERMLKGIH